jgi:hypothetical protein
VATARTRVEHCGQKCAAKVCRAKKDICVEGLHRCISVAVGEKTMMLFVKHTRSGFASKATEEQSHVARPGREQDLGDLDSDF